MLKQNAEIRILTPNDAVALKLFRAGAAEDPAFGITPETEATYTPALLARTLNDSSLSCTLGAFVGEGLAGMVGFGRGLEAGTGTLYGLFVLAFYRRRGIARSLVQALLAEALQRDVPHVLLEVTSDNEPAVRLYRACGFAGHDVGGITNMSWRAGAS